MNVIVSCVERTGGSWLGLILSEIHKRMFGKEIKWNYEISRLMAISKDHTFPEGWSSVYYVPLDQLLKRGYDKIILLERDLEDIKRAMLIYHKQMTDFDNPVHKPFFDKIEKYWNLAYGNPIEDPRIFRVNLKYINQYAVACFSEILDFLEFPYKIKSHTTLNWCVNYDKEAPMCEEQECGKCLTFTPKTDRPVLFPINLPERNWMLYSCLLPKNWGLDARLYKIEKLYGYEPKRHEEPDPTPKEYSQIIMNPYYVNPYKLTDVEREYQKNGSFRLFYDNPIPDTLEELGLIEF